MGRKPKLTPHQIAEVRDRKAGGESVRFLARSYGCEPEHDIKGQISVAPADETCN
jgi:hypothetical protein